MAYTNNNGQIRVGVRSGITNSPIQQATTVSASLIQSLYGVWNGDTTTNELDKSLFGVWNADTNVSVTTLNTGLYSVYKGENNSNDSLSNYNGVVYGGLTYSTGKSGNAFQFNGSNSYVRLADNSMNFAGDFSICAWVYVPTSMTGLNTFPIIYNTQAPTWFNNPYGYSFIVYSGSLQFSIFNGTNTYYTISSLYTFTNGNSVGNSWYHVSVVRKASTGSKLYINGVIVKSDTNLVNPVYTGAFPLTPTIGNCLMGNNGSVQNGYYAPNGSKIDELYFWNKELTDTEIRALYNLGSGNFYPSLTSLTTASANDAFGSNHGTLMNGCTFTTGKIGNSFTFDGVDDYIALPDNIFNFTGDFSASAWFYTPSAAYVHSGIVGNYNWGAKTGWGIYTYQNRLYVNIHNVAGDYSTVYIDNSVVGSWNHVTMVFKKGTGFYLYMNGELKNSFTLTNNVNAGISPAYSATQKAYIGLLNYPGDWWYAKNGYKIDGVNVWQRAISQDEITQLYNLGSGVQYPFVGTLPSTMNQLGVDNGTLMNGCYLSTGKIGQAFTFDGVNDYVQFPNNSLNLTNNYSINLWLYLTSSQSTTLLSVFGNDGFNKGFYIDITSLSSYTFRFVGFNNNSNVIALNGTGNLGYLNRWSMATLTVSGTSVKIYLDGTLASSGEMSVPINYTSTTYPTLGAFRNGSGTPNSHLSNGTKIDGLSVWQKELTQSEITELYNSGNGKQITATPIVQTGLVLNLDASRKSSYTGTGTTWTDISGSGNNGTLLNGVGYSSVDGGSLTFDQVNDYISLPNMSTHLINKSKFTYETWIKLNNPGMVNTYLQTLFSFGNSGQYSNDIMFFIQSNYLNIQINNGADGTCAIPYASTSWNNVCIVYDGTQTINSDRIKIYINGILQTITTTYTIPSTTTNINMTNCGIGAYSCNNFANCHFGGNIGSARLYTTSLTSTEVTQNFNATKSRFGY